MPHFQKIGIYANNGTSHVRSAITKLEASLDDFGCGVFFEKLQRQGWRTQEKSSKLPSVESFS